MFFFFFFKTENGIESSDFSVCFQLIFFFFFFHLFFHSCITLNSYTVFSKFLVLFILLPNLSKSSVMLFFFLALPTPTSNLVSAVGCTFGNTCFCSHTWAYITHTHTQSNHPGLFLLQTLARSQRFVSVGTWLHHRGTRPLVFFRRGEEVKNLNIH